MSHQDRSGRSIDASGYVRIWRPGHPLAMADGYVLEHRLVWFEAYGTLADGFDVHHKNHIKDDNRLENLEAKSASDHSREHVQERGYVANGFGKHPLHDPDEHGTVWAYKHGCRCTPCTAANTEYCGRFRRARRHRAFGGGRP